MLCSMSTIYKIPILLEKCGKTHLMFDINKISLMYLVVVVIYFLAVPGGPGKPGQPSRCPGKDAQIYLSIHQETSNYLSTLPALHPRPRLIQLTPGPEDCTIQTDGRRQDGPIMADRDLTRVFCLYNNVL